MSLKLGKTQPTFNLDLILKLALVYNFTHSLKASVYDCNCSNFRLLLKAQDFVPFLFLNPASIVIFDCLRHLYGISAMPLASGLPSGSCQLNFKKRNL